MKKPEYTKPFDLEHARAGAPFVCANGDEVEILKWDAAGGNCPLVGMVGANVQRWSTNGGAGGLNKEHLGLVMLPLGFIDGKPVWVGDEIETKSFSANGAWEAVKVCPGDHGFTTCRWPALAPVYPTFDGSVDMLSIEYKKKNNFRNSLVRVANFALRHAIDAGQVVLPNGDGMSAELVRAQALLAETRKMLARDAERDLAVAQAVLSAAAAAIEPANMPFLSGALVRINLPAIIAGVTK